jgi:hypothetical protein
MKLRTIIVLNILLLSSSNLTAKPVECKSKRGARAYNAAYQIQSEQLAALWTDYGGCERFSDFVEDVVVDFNAGTVRSPSIICRNYGAQKALENKLIEFSVSCDDAVVESGAAVGTIAGELYCVTKQVPDLWLKLKSEDASIACKEAVIATLEKKCVAPVDEKVIEDLVTHSCGG